MNYKESEVGIIPKDWEIVTMEEALEKIIDYRGKTPKKSDSGILTLSAKSVKNGYIDYSSAYFISEKTYEEFMVRGMPKIGDILLTTEAPLGYVARLDRDDIGLAQRLLTLRGKKDYLYNDYLRYYLMSPVGQHQLKARESGTTVTGIKQSEFRKALIPIPPYKEQKAIGHVLSILDEKIETNNKINENLGEIAEALFKHWFVNFEFPNENREPYKSSGGEMVESELGSVPLGWQIAELKDLIKVKHGYAFKSKDFTDQNTNLLVLTPGNFKIGGGFKNDKFKYLSENVSFPEEYVLSSGDLIITMTDLSRDGDTLGYPAIIPNDNENLYLHNQRLGKAELKKKFSIMYLYQILCSEKYRWHILSTATGTTVKHTAPKRIEKFKLLIPPDHILDEFDKLVSLLMNELDNLNLENRLLLNIREALLPKLTSGEIRIPLDG